MPVSDVTRLFKTLSDPTRLRLLRLMGAHELSVGELSEVTGLAQSRVSNHLKVLRDDDLVQERRDGSWRLYRLDRDRLPEVAQELWPGIEAAWNGDDQFLADQARLEQVLAGRHGRNGRYFDDIADQWDDVRADLFGDAIGRELLRTFVPRDITVADVGCGTGYVLELFADKPRKLIAIDNSEAMLAVARKKVEAMGLHNVDFRRGDAHEPPLAAGEADLITFVMVLHYLEDPIRAIRSAAKVLGSGGRMLITDFTAHQETWLRESMAHRWLGFSREELATQLKEMGLHVVAGAVLPGKPFVAGEQHKARVPDGFFLLAEKG